MATFIVYNFERWDEGGTYSIGPLGIEQNFKGIVTVPCIKIIHTSSTHRYVAWNLTLLLHVGKRKKKKLFLR